MTGSASGVAAELSPIIPCARNAAGRDGTIQRSKRFSNAETSPSFVPAAVVRERHDPERMENRGRNRFAIVKMLLGN